MNKQGYSKQDNPLRLLIESADKKSIEALNLTKEDLGIVDKDGRSPIFWCCTFGQSTILEYFLQLGADINAADKVYIYIYIEIYIYIYLYYRGNGEHFM